MFFMNVRFDRNRLRLLLHAVIPLAAGAAFYILFSPDVYFVKLLGITRGFFRDQVRVIRFYFPDMMWGYALLFSIFMVLGAKKHSPAPAFVISAGFSLLMECLQLNADIPGSFDPIDIAVEIAAEGLAVFIIKKRVLTEVRTNEDQKSDGGLPVSASIRDNGSGQRLFGFGRNEKDRIPERYGRR